MKTTPAPPIEIAEAPHGTPLLDHWRGIYDHVFFAFNPLYRVPVPPGKAVEVTRSDDGNLWLSADYKPDAVDPFDVFTWQKQQAQTLRWFELHARVAPDAPFKDFAIALWLISVLGYQDGYRDLQQRILDHTEQNGWTLPDENMMPKVMEPTLHTYLKALNLKAVTAYDEFRNHSAPLAAKNLARNAPGNWITVNGRATRINALHAPDPGVLIYWSFDDITACIAMTEKARALAKPEDVFEGLYATRAMQADFLRQL